MRFKVQSLWLMLLLLLTTGVVHAQVTTSAVYQNGSGALILCNNLILNNETDTETNVSSVPTSNILGGDFYSFFENLTSKYDIMVGTPAHNAGDNQCVDWDRDLKGEERRACGGRVDVGAYEVGLIEHSCRHGDGEPASADLLYGNSLLGRRLPMEWFGYHLCGSQ